MAQCNKLFCRILILRNLKLIELENILGHFVGMCDLKLLKYHFCFYFGPRFGSYARVKIITGKTLTPGAHLKGNQVLSY